MELTVRTPYATLLENHEGFSRLITKTNEACLVIGNKSPPAIYNLPAGALKVKLTSDVPGVSGDWLHQGGWCIVHLDNTCEINLFDAVDRSLVKPDAFGKGGFEEKDTLAGRYATRLRNTAQKTWTKKATG